MNIKTEMYVIQMNDWFKKSKGLDLRLEPSAYYAWNQQPQLYVDIVKETEKAIMVKVIDHGLLDNYYKDRKFWIPRSQLVRFEKLEWDVNYLK